jgi:hypothetical protein
VSLATLIPAWHACLNTIVVIPCLDSYMRVVRDDVLTVTAEALKQLRSGFPSDTASERVADAGLAPDLSPDKARRSCIVFARSVGDR